MIAYCGLKCDSCRILLATLEKDGSKQQLMRTDIVKICNEQYGMKVSLDDITDCDGCRAPDERVFSGCRSCDIRACARERNLETCAVCVDFFCPKLDRIFREDPQSKVRLEEIRQSKA